MDQERTVVAHLVARLKAIPDGQITKTAMRAGVASRQLRKLRRGESPDIRISTLEKLARGMGTSMADLLGEAPDARPEPPAIDAEQARVVRQLAHDVSRLAAAADRLLRAVEAR